MKLLRKTLQIVNKILTVLLFVVFCTVILIVVSNRFSGGEFQLFHYQLKTVLSGSMEPEFKTGSVIAIETTDGNKQFHKGDVITFKKDDNMLVTHRVAKVLENGQAYQTKGDANNGPDMEPVSAENVVGQYTGFRIPYAGYVLEFANSKAGASLLMVLPGLLLLGYALFSIWRVFKELDNMKNQKTASQTKE
ncbi:signal peptidase I SipW [Virgibacillus halophilus]|uniref:signal peptidase I SipW n=1 Tax=Tigheibacillus halophilus TaxID=361280 RepID=UPI003643B7B3